LNKVRITLQLRAEEIQKFIVLFKHLGTEYKQINKYINKYIPNETTFQMAVFSVIAKNLTHIHATCLTTNGLRNKISKYWPNSPDSLLILVSFQGALNEQEAEIRGCI